MFSGIAPRYDAANSTLTCGLHHLWRRRIVALARLEPGGRAVDLATGTGDIALLLKRAVGPGGEVTGVDFCAEMLVLARRKATGRKLAVEYLEADILALPFSDGVFDAATIGFGVRNTSDANACLREMARVVRRGGRLVILETGQPPNRLVKRAVELLGALYFRTVGALVARDAQAYAYLHQSTLRFPAGREFTAMLRQAGQFSEIESYPLAAGVAWIYAATVA